jgi:hypothetical protein
VIIITKGIIKISRELDGIKFITSEFTDEIENKILVEFAKGNPIGKYIKSLTIDNMIFFLYFEGDSNEAYILIVGVEKQDLRDNILNLSATYEFVSSSKLVSYKYKRPTLNEAMRYFSEVEGLPGLLFTFFTNLKLIILGSEADNLQTILNALQFIPPKIAKNQSFCSYAENLNEEVEWFGMPATRKSYELIQGLETSHTIFSTTKLKCLSPYSCELLEELSMLIKKEMYKEAQLLIKKIFTNLFKIMHCTTAEQISDILDTTLSNSDFYLKVLEFSTKISENPDVEEWR